MPDEARAKLHLAIGKALLLTATASPESPDLEALEEARTNLARAIDLHSSCGGKRPGTGIAPAQETRAKRPPVTDSGEPSAN